MSSSEVGKRRLVGVMIVCLCAANGLHAAPVGPEQARQVATVFLTRHSARSAGAKAVMSIAATQTPTVIHEIRDVDGNVLAYVADVAPRGFVATSAQTHVTPIIAYSLRHPFPTDPDNPLVRFLTHDMKQRAQAPTASENLWLRYTDGPPEGAGPDSFQQWPEAGATTTGGWLETAWHQDVPYNQFCPLDPVDGLRAYVGCVATALAQLTHYHRHWNARFTQSDAYTTYGGIDVDADATRYDFATFAELNDHLDSVVSDYVGGTDLNDAQVAALSFACGVATRMDFSSEGSGASPFAMQEALLDKLGYYSAELIGGLSSESGVALRQNMINALPAVLGIAVPGERGGHVVVCDGYNTNGEYHLNFGWGGQSPDAITEAWYHVPVGIPYLSSIQEAIVNVRPKRPAIDVFPGSLQFQALPGQDSQPQTFRIRCNVSAGVRVHSISCPDGFVAALWSDTYSSELTSNLLLEGNGTVVTIRIRYRPDQPGAHRGPLTVRYDDGAAQYVLLDGCAYSGGTQVQAGSISGSWTQAGSPYFVLGDVNVREHAMLAIEPGVQVFFMGRYSMTVGEDASLIVLGTPTDRVEFSAWNRDAGWTGLRLLESGDDDVLRYCTFSYAKKPTSAFDEDERIEDFTGGALHCYASDPQIDGCKFVNNSGDVAGAIYCDDSRPTITNTLIANNTCTGGRLQCGGLCAEYDSLPRLENCTIVNNHPGGLFTASHDGIDVTNSILWGNGDYQIAHEYSTPTVTFSDVQGGFKGDGNSDVDPCFFEPTLGVGIDYDAAAGLWTLKSSSPCINAGAPDGAPSIDLAGLPRIHSGVVDLGAYENQSDLPLITVTPSPTVDAGFHLVGINAMTQIDVTNTGALDVEIESLSCAAADGVFTVENPPNNVTLAPGEMLTFSIEFAPPAEKVYTDTLLIQSTASNGSPKAVSLRGVGVAGTVIHPGPVEGDWTEANGPYSVTGDIYIAPGRQLQIEEGVVVKFAGRFNFTVGHRATLLARGSERKRILFTATDKDEGWAGLQFINAEDDDHLRYCTLEYSKKPYTEGGRYFDQFGGAVLCVTSWEDTPDYPLPSNPIIEHCTMSHNLAEYGGAFAAIEGAEPIVTHCTFMDNTAETDGGAIFLYFAGGIYTNNVVAHNSAIFSGGLSTWLALPSIVNNTFAHNRPNGLYLGPTTMFPWEVMSLPVHNNIVWNNEVLAEYYYDDEYDVRFNNIQGGWDGPGNLDVDPHFADPNERDYHLMSADGRWDPAKGTWVRDDVTSPCIDAGDPDADWTNELSPNGGRINMGAYGGTVQAGLSPLQQELLPDLDGDGQVDYRDVTNLTDKWLEIGPLPEDLDRTGAVNGGDFCLLANQWLARQLAP